MEALTNLDRTLRPPYVFSCVGVIYRVSTLKDPAAPMQRLVGTHWVSSPLTLAIAVGNLNARQLTRPEIRALGLGHGVAA